MPLMEGSLVEVDTKNLPDRLELRRFVDEVYTDGVIGPIRYREIVNRIDNFGVKMYELGQQVGAGKAIGAS